MTVRNKCRAILFIGAVAAIPGIVVLAADGADFLTVIVTYASFWLSGSLFVVAMIGDGHEGLGVKRND